MLFLYLFASICKAEPFVLLVQCHFMIFFLLKKSSSFAKVDPILGVYKGTSSARHASQSVDSACDTHLTQRWPQEDASSVRTADGSDMRVLFFVA